MERQKIFNKDIMLPHPSHWLDGVNLLWLDLHNKALAVIIIGFPFRRLFGLTKYTFHLATNQVADNSINNLKMENEMHIFNLECAHSYLNLAQHVQHLNAYSFATVRVMIQCCWKFNHNDLKKNKTKKVNWPQTSYPVALFMQAMLTLISQRNSFDWGFLFFSFLAGTYHFCT